MIPEEIRYVFEDLERLEEGIVKRLEQESTHIRDRLNREHEVNQLLEQIQKQSVEGERLLEEARGPRAEETRLVGPTGDPMDLFYSELHKILDHHARYPNEPLDQPEQRYATRQSADPYDVQPTLVDTIFSGEEAFGRFFDLNIIYEQYINLPNIKRISYLQYLEVFDNFTPGTLGSVRRADKMTDAYFKYVGELADYLESFMRKTRPLENLDQVFAGFTADFNRLWEQDELPNWKAEKPVATADGDQPMLSSPDATWCPDCEKEFTNPNVYKAHLTGRKHVKAAEKRAKRLAEGGDGGNAASVASLRLKERAVAAREYRVQRLVGAMSTEKDDTRTNVERRQGMTERERQQELENLYTITTQPQQKMKVEGNEEEDGEEKIYNPLKLPLAWDGKPIPFWLYRLHGLGVEFDCEICGHYIYKGRRAFEKHFNEGRHIHGLRCLGITDPVLFRDITNIEEAVRLWEKVQKNKKKSKVDESSVVQMEDAEGHVMPEKVYYDLQKQGLI